VLTAFASSGKPHLAPSPIYPEHYCLKSLGAFGACVRVKGHTSPLCSDAMGQTFLGKRQTTIAEWRQIRTLCGEIEAWDIWIRAQKMLAEEQRLTYAELVSAMTTHFTQITRLRKELEAIDVVICDLGHAACEDHLHSEAYHSCDCRCGRTDATCAYE